MAGDFWAFEEFVTSAKMNFQIDATAKHIAISNVKVLQSNNVFENGDESFVDEFLDADGTNDTLETFDGSVYVIIEADYITGFTINDCAQKQIASGSV